MELVHVVSDLKRVMPFRPINFCQPQFVCMFVITAWQGLPKPLQLNGCDCGVFACMVRALQVNIRLHSYTARQTVSMALTLAINWAICDIHIIYSLQRAAHMLTCVLCQVHIPMQHSFFRRDHRENR